LNNLRLLKATTGNEPTAKRLLSTSCLIHNEIPEMQSQLMASDSSVQNNPQAFVLADSAFL
jgi:hypothetical protein